MVEYRLGLSPGVIVGGVLVLLALVIMLAATVFVVWRSRPSAIARAHRQQKSLAPADIERALAKAKVPESSTMEKGEGDISDATTAPSSDGDPQSPLAHFPTMPLVSHSNGSTLNVIISPSVPHLVKLGADGGVELRVTPPSPVLIPGDHSVRFGGLAGGMPGENESVWWFI